MTVIIGRSGWGALPPHWPIPEQVTPAAFVVHHSAGVQPTSFEESVACVQAIQRQHLNTTTPNGAFVYGDIAYNVVAGWNCVLVGRGITLSDGATDADPTTDTWSVCVLGDYTKDRVLPEIRAGLETALTLGADLYGPKPIRPHRDYYATACPGRNLIDLIPTLGDGDDMNVQEFFGHPLVLSDGEPPVAYPTTVEGWFVYVHRELQIIRQNVQALEAKP